MSTPKDRSNSVNSVHHIGNVMVQAKAIVQNDLPSGSMLAKPLDAPTCQMSRRTKARSADEFSTCNPHGPLQKSLYALCVSWGRRMDTVCPPVRSKFVIEDRAQDGRLCWCTWRSNVSDWIKKSFVYNQKRLDGRSDKAETEDRIYMIYSEWGIPIVVTCSSHQRCFVLKK